jgi:hydrogenase maturation factor
LCRSIGVQAVEDKFHLRVHVGFADLGRRAAADDVKVWQPCYSYKVNIELLRKANEGYKVLTHIGISRLSCVRRRSAISVFQILRKHTRRRESL